MTESMAGEIEIIPVEGSALLERFIKVPMRLQADDPNYIAPLMFERREALSAKHNPFFEHADVQFWLAVRDGVDVGRISAQIDHIARTDPAAPAGYFGMIAAEDDDAIFAALFKVAEDWLRARGRASVVGPMNLSINEEVGLLIDGFDRPAMLMMGHDCAYVAARIEAQGYAKVKDVYAYISNVPPYFSRRVQARLDGERPKGMHLRQVRMNKFDEEVNTLVEIWNDAWSENWGAAPITEAETKYLGQSLKLILNPKFVWFLEIDGEVAAFAALLPNLNDATYDLKGKLLPFGWAKLLWRLKIRGVKRGRVPLMGVKKKFGGTVRGALAPFVLIDQLRTQALAAKYVEAEYSWILEDNRPMRHILEGIGARIYKTYRLYGKDLTVSAS
jgi:hypothetical protein